MKCSWNYDEFLALRFYNCEQFFSGILGMPTWDHFAITLYSVYKKVLPNSVIHFLFCFPFREFEYLPYHPLACTYHWLFIDYLWSIDERLKDARILSDCMFSFFAITQMYVLARMLVDVCLKWVCSEDQWYCIHLVGSEYRSYTWF